jgi:hypothetical protein
MASPKHPEAPPLIRDWRRPGQPMAALPIKLPADLLEALAHRAQRLGCARTALARDLIAQGLDRLESAAAIDGEVA